MEQILKIDVAEASIVQTSQNLEAFDKELEGPMKAKTAASSKLFVGEARVQDMAFEIAIAE